MIEENIFNLTNSQKNIWNAEQFYSGTPINNICAYIMINESINFDYLKLSINKLVEQNDSFRLKFHIRNSIPVQEITQYQPFDIEIIDVNTEQNIIDYANNIVKTCFNIYDSDLFHFTIFKFRNNTGALLLNIHHLICDAWSLDLTLNKIISIYQNISNQISDKNSKTYSYIDYIKRENKYLYSKIFKSDEQYWKDTFNIVPEIASIPSTYEVSNKLISTSKNINFTINKKLFVQINNLCRNNNISIYNFFMAIFSIYLGSVSHLTNFVIGTPILNRTNFAEKNTTGMFVNTVPLNINLDFNESFNDFSLYISRLSLTMLRHQKYPYELLMRNLRKKNPSLPNLYDCLISYQIDNSTIDKENLYKENWIHSNTISDSLRIHLRHNLNNNSLLISYEFLVDKYSDEDIINLNKRLIFIIEQVLSNPNTKLKDLEITPTMEKNQILNIFDSLNVNFPKDKTLVDIFEEIVSKYPNNVALKINDSEMTYNELNEKSNQLAYYLKSKGITKGDIIGLRFKKSFEMIISILAIIKCGAVYLPINLSYPFERVDFMLKDSNAKYLLTSNELKNDMNISIDILLTDLSNHNIYNGNSTNPNHILSQNDLLYIIYTSGSTGTPKGATITHRNVVRLFFNDKPLYDFNERDVWTMFHSVAFDFSVWEMYGALLFGGKLILVPENIAIDPYAFLMLLRLNNVTVLNQTPTYFYNLLDNELKINDSNLSIRYIIFGGEALKPNLIIGWKNKYPNTQLINMYGITETTVHVTYKNLSLDDLNTPSSNIGIPIPTLGVYLFNEQLKLVPFGVEGEIFVAGAGICKGYLNRPDLNSTRFIDNPYKPGELLYRSGDSAILKNDGNLYYMGRIDKQLKLRGFRVELGEIETKLLKHKSISKCVVLPKNVNDKDCYLIAYIVCKQDIPTSEIKEYISKLVPSYMVPNYFVKVKQIPLNINGKVDSKKLLNMNLEIEKNIPYFAPRNDFEKTFVKILEETLNLKDIGIDDNILEIGTDSLTLMKITINLLEKNYKINIQDIYNYKTIRNINDHLLQDKIQNSKISENLYYKFDENYSKDKFNFKNILLTGATGFLGIHILHDLIKNSDCSIFCLVRSKNNRSSKTRLSEKLQYYFGNELTSEIDKRIIVIDGCIENDNIGLTSSDYNNLKNTIDMVIHTAALVSHYGSIEKFNKINVKGTNNIIKFCTESHLPLNYISTTSVSGFNTSKSVKNFDEHCLYIGQNYEDNIYIKTKFEAEYNIWLAINNGLVASIYRLGNITARYTDGVFQENDTQNAFLNRIIAFIKIQKIPQSLIEQYFDFSPVDICSNIISTLVLYKSSYNKVFHIFNNNKVKLKDVIDYLNNINHKIDIINDYDFNSELKNIKEKEDLLGIINDITNNNLFENTITVDCKFTIEYLKHYSLNWPKITKEYLDKYLQKYINGGNRLENKK